MDRAQTDAMLKHWRWETEANGLAWLTFDKQGESTNTFSRQALEELGTALDAIAALKPKGLVIRSAKENFIAGADVNEFVRFQTPAEAVAFTRLGWDTMQKLRDLPFPTTAMVNGFCMGGGLEMALACTYRVALDDPKTRFAFPEVMLGIWPFWHGLQWLPKLVGPAAALDMILTGRTIDARRAKRMGLATEAVPLRILENTARMVTLEAKPPGCASALGSPWLASCSRSRGPSRSAAPPPGPSVAVRSSRAHSRSSKRAPAGAWCAPWASKHQSEARPVSRKRDRVPPFSPRSPN